MNQRGPLNYRPAGLLQACAQEHKHDMTGKS